MTDGSVNDLLLNRLAEEFAARYRRGERPSLREYTEKHPDLADDIRDLFPALVGMERAREDREEFQPPASRLPPLQQLDDYRIIREIGHGGMGVVYEAEQLSLGRHVALKILPRTLLRESKQRQRFEREVRAAAQLHHTNIVPVFSVGEHDGLPYYTMQFIQGLGLDEVIDELKRMQPGGARVEGSSVPAEKELRVARKDVSAVEMARSLIRGEFQSGPASDEAEGAAAPSTESEPVPSGGRLSDAFELSSAETVLTGPRSESSGSTRRVTYWQSVARVGVQVANALEYAHQQGIQHRDVKPSNLLLDTRGTVWVTDFGLAKVEDQGNLTDTGDVLGTIRYMPPEAFDGKHDVRGDVYSLGLTLYELLVLRPAFVDKDRSKLIKLVTTGEPPRLNRVNRAIPRDLVTIVHKAIEREPGHRYPRAGELAADLQRFLDDVPIKVRRASAVEQLARWSRRHKGLASALGVIALLLVAFSIWAGFTASRLGQLAADRKSALDQESRAREEERWQRYRANVATAAGALELNNLAAAQRALDDAPEEYRDCWEWRHLHSQFDSARTLLHSTRTSGRLEHMTVSSLGTQIAAWDNDAQQVRVWDARSGADLAALPCQEERVIVVAFSPDGRQLASTGERGTVRRWELATGRPLALGAAPEPVSPSTTRWERLSYSPDGLRLAAWNENAVRLWDLAGDAGCKVLRRQALMANLVFSPDGTRLVAGRDSEIILFEAATGRQLAVLGHQVGTSYAVEFSPNGRRIAFSYDRLIHLWDGVTGKEVALLTAHANWPRTMKFSPDGSILASGATYPDCTVCLWRASDGRLLSKQAGHKNEIASLVFSRDGKRLISASTDQTVRLWDVTTGQPLAVLRGHTSKLKGADFSPDGERIVSWCGKEVRLWDGRSGDLLLVLHGHGEGVERAAFAAGGAVVASEAGGMISLWDTDLSKHGILAGHQSFVYDVAFSPDGKLLASTAWDHTLRIWDLTGDLSSRRVELEDAHVVGVAFRPDGKQLAVTTLQGHLHLLSVPGFQHQCVLDTPKRFRYVPPRPAYAPNGSLVAANLTDDDVGLWDPDSGVMVGKLHETDCRPCDVAFRPDGIELAAGGEGGVVTIWNVARRERVAKLAGHAGAVYKVAFSPDGRRLASGSLDRTVRIWDAHTYKELAVLPCGDFTYGLSFSPDGSRLAVGCADNAIHLFDMATGQQVAELRGHSDYVHAVAFSPDGTRLASSSGDLTLRLWDTLSPNERARMTRR